MGTTNSNFKRCSTCEYWTGSRQPDRFGKTVTVEGTASANCLACGSKRHDYNTCMKYKKWGVLR